MTKQFSNPRHQALYDGWCKRINGCDIIDIQTMMKEVQSNPSYLDYTDEDHQVYLHLVPAIVGQELKLSGDTSHLPPRERLAKQAQNLRDGTVQPANGITLQQGLDAINNEIANISTQDAAKQKLHGEMQERWEAQDAMYADEQAGRTAKQKETFMQSELRHVPPEGMVAARAKAEERWHKYQNQWGN